MIVLLYGGDELGIRRRLDDLRAEADGGTGMIDSNLTVLDGRDAKPQEVIAACMAAPFLSARRLVIVEHLFERYEGRRDSRALPKNVEALVSALESGVPEWTIVVLLGAPFGRETTAVTISASNTLVSRVAKIPGVVNVHLPALSGPALLDYIVMEAKRRGIRFRPGKPADRLRPGERMPEESEPARLLAALCQSDTLSIANELDKLALYAPGQEITVVEVNRVCAGERAATIWNLRDAVLDGNLGLACECRDRLLRDGAEYNELFSNVADGYRAVARLVDAVEDRLPVDEIGRLMGNAGRYPNLRDQMIRRVRTIGRDGVRRGFHVLVEAERSIKQGEADDDVAFDIALARLCELARPQPAQRRR